MPILDNIDIFALSQGYIADNVTYNQDGSAVGIAYTSTSDPMHISVRIAEAQFLFMTFFTAH